MKDLTRNYALRLIVLLTLSVSGNENAPSFEKNFHDCFTFEEIEDTRFEDNTGQPDVYVEGEECYITDQSDQCNNNSLCSKYTEFLRPANHSADSSALRNLVGVDRLLDYLLLHDSGIIRDICSCNRYFQHKPMLDCYTIRMTGHHEIENNSNKRREELALLYKSLPADDHAPTLLTTRTATASSILCNRQKLLQRMIYDQSPTKTHYTIPNLESWTHSKMVKPFVTVKHGEYASLGSTDYIRKFTNFSLYFNIPISRPLEFHFCYSMYRITLGLLFYCTFIAASLHSITKSAQPLCSLVEKKMFDFNPFSFTSKITQKDPLSDLVENGHMNSNNSNPKTILTPEELEMKNLQSIHNFKPQNTDGMVYTLAKYADNHNPVLSLALQQQLDAMSPKEYLPYILGDLTLDERESLMIDEAQRRKTFLVNWPHEKNLSGIEMAKSGFYSLNDYDRVQCVFCRGSLHKWELDDIPMNEHQKLFPFCRYVKGMECGNREFRSKKLTDDDLKNVTKYGVPSGRGVSRDCADNVSLGISTNRAASVQYATEAARLKTYSRWSSHVPVSSKDLCEAGFYYTGFDDQVRCFFCSGGLREWQKGDKPWEEHARWFPECLFLVHQKGQPYIDQVHEETPEEKKSTRKTQFQKKIEAKKKMTFSMQEEMLRICQRLGYQSDLINRAIEINGKHFETIGKMLDALGVLEETDPSRSLETSNATGTTLKESVRAIIPEEDHQRVFDEVDQASRYDGKETVHKFEQGCWNCEARANTFTKASQIGLPCGHLIFCDNCHAEQEKRSKDPNYKVMCPYKHCGTTLNGSMKVYFG